MIKELLRITYDVQSSPKEWGGQAVASKKQTDKPHKLL
jgi:hypothetical protein